MLFQQTPDGRTRLDRSLCLFRCRGRFHLDLLLDWLRLRRSRCDLAFLEDRQHVARFDRRTVLHDDLAERTGSRCRNLEHDLVCFEVDEILVARDALANTLVPRDQRGIGYGLR